MARSWGELLGEPDGAQEPDEEGGGRFFARLRDSLSKARRPLTGHPAAAEEQLEIWARRAGADFVGSERGADPASVAYDALEAAVARGRDTVVVDTAGRLHTQVNLMEELAKVRRVIAGRLEGAPHETLLVADLRRVACHACNHHGAVLRDDELPGDRLVGSRKLRQ